VYPRGLPARRWLDYYAALFDTVEVNTTFYRLPSTTAVGGWARCSGSCRRTFTGTTSGLGAALAALPSGRHAFEFRHPSWFADEVYNLLRARGVALVIADRPEIRRFQTHERTADFAFLRFHHGGGDGSYTHRRLGAWARRIEEWRVEGDVYAYFNNDWEGYAVENALWLQNRLSR
jgi:uncharacterized protein YecE (DUF72 family)